MYGYANIKCMCVVSVSHSGGSRNLRTKEGACNEDQGFWGSTAPRPPTNFLQFRTYFLLLLYTLETLSIHVIKLSIVTIGRTGGGGGVRRVRPYVDQRLSVYACTLLSVPYIERVLSALLCTKKKLCMARV